MSGFEIFDNHHHENFAAGVVAFAINHSEDFALDFVNVVLEKAKQPRIHKARIKALREQVISNLRRPDLQIEANEDDQQFLILVEAKIGAAEQLNQLADYRKWLDGQRAQVKILATLTRTHLKASEKPHAEVFWCDLRGPIKNRIAGACSLFERSFWESFQVFLEETMETFSGFKTAFTNVVDLMHEIDLLLIGIFRDAMKLETWTPQVMDNGYWIPLGAVVGFQWRETNGFGKDQLGKLLVWRDRTPKTSAISVATFDEIAENSKCAQEEGKLTEFLEEMGHRVKNACDPPFV